MIATVGLLVLLVVPTLVWVTVRYWPKPGGRPGQPAGKVTASGVKHRWWQP